MESQTQPKSYAEIALTAIPQPENGELEPGKSDRLSARLTPRQRWIALGLLVFGLGALGWLAFNNPLGHSYLPRCPTEAYGHFYCPGCGATRATHHMLQGRAATAMGYNPLLVIVGTPLILWTLGSLGYQAVTGRRPWRPTLPGYVGWTAVVVTIAFMVLRNLPGGVFDPLRPTPVEVDQANYHNVSAD